MYKVFLNQNVIILTSEIQLGSNITVLPLKKTSIGKIISNVKKHKKIYLYHHNSKKLISRFKKKIKVVKAGGGIVTNFKKELKSKPLISIITVVKNNDKYLFLVI